MSSVQLVAPTTPDERIRLAAERTDGWLYLVSLTGTTGARAEVSAQLGGLVERARRVTEVPLLAGFGISTAEQALEAGPSDDPDDPVSPDGTDDFRTTFLTAPDGRRIELVPWPAGHADGLSAADWAD